MVDAIYRRDIGYETEEIQTVVEESKAGTKKIVKTKKVVGPDFNATRYFYWFNMAENIMIRNKKLKWWKKDFKK